MKPPPLSAVTIVFKWPLICPNSRITVYFQGQNRLKYPRAWKWIKMLLIKKSGFIPRAWDHQSHRAFDFYRILGISKPHPQKINGGSSMNEQQLPRSLGSMYHRVLSLLLFFETSINDARNEVPFSFLFFG